MAQLLRWSASWYHVNIRSASILNDALFVVGLVVHERHPLPDEPHEVARQPVFTSPPSSPSLPKQESQRSSSPSLQQSPVRPATSANADQGVEQLASNKHSGRLGGMSSPSDSPQQKRRKLCRPPASSLSRDSAQGTPNYLVSDHSARPPKDELGSLQIDPALKNPGQPSATKQASQGSQQQIQTSREVLRDKTPDTSPHAPDQAEPGLDHAMLGGSISHRILLVLLPACL